MQSNSNSPQWSRKDLLYYGLGGLLLLFLLYNSLMRDYKAETRSYLTSVGKKDAIDKVVPKTYDEIRQERLKRDALIDQLSSNMTTVMKELKHLRTEVDSLKQKSTANAVSPASAASTATPAPAGK